MKKIYILSSKDDWRREVASKLGRDVLRRLDDNVQLDEAVVDPSMKLPAKHTPAAVARSLIDAQNRLDELRAEKDLEAPSTPNRQPRSLSETSSVTSVEEAATTSVTAVDVRDDADDELDLFTDCLAPALSPREMMLELAEADRSRPGWSVGYLSMWLRRFVILQVGATGCLFALAVLALIDPSIAWDPHLPAVGLLLAAASLPFATLGLVGATRLNLGVLRIHASAQATLTVAFLVSAPSGKSVERSRRRRGTRRGHSANAATETPTECRRVGRRALAP